MPILMLIVFTQRPFSRSPGIRPGSGIRPSTCVGGDFKIAQLVCVQPYRARLCLLKDIYSVTNELVFMSGSEIEAN